MRFFCQTCPYLFQIADKVEKKVPLQRKQVDDVLGGDEAWENVDQTESTASWACHCCCFCLLGEMLTVSTCSLSLQRAARTASSPRRTSCRSRSARPTSPARRSTSACSARSSGTTSNLQHQQPAANHIVIPRTLLNVSNAVVVVVVVVTCGSAAAARHRCGAGAAGSCRTCPCSPPG